jgi:hypothetical protein
MNLSETTKTFLKWRKCEIEKEELYDMFLQEHTNEILDIDRQNMRDKMIKIYDKKCKKLYNGYRRTCLY